MKKQPADVELRNIPKRPFGVYALVTILLLGVFAATLEIVQVETELSGFWATAASLLRDYSGLVSLAGLLFDSPAAVIVVNSLIIIVWMLVIVGMWKLQRWAWLTVMIFSGVNLTYALFRYFADNPDYISMLINVAVVFYLNERSVQHAYARRKPEVQA